MIKSYLVIAFRNISKNKAFSFINIVGLAIGMAACLLILQYVTFELSYDGFLPKKERIFRVTQDRYNNGKLATQWASGAFAAGSALKANFPEIEDFVKLSATQLVQVGYKEKQITSTKSAFFAGSSFFNVLPYKLLSGNAASVLKDAYTVVLSKSLAHKVFGTANPVGQLIKLNKDHAFKVTGIVQDFPANTHLKSDILISWSTLIALVGPKGDLDNQWMNDGCLTYLLLKPGTDPKALERKFIPYINKVYSAYPTDIGTAYHLQPLKDIHLYSHLMMEAEPNGDGKSVYLLLGIAIFVIVIAWINYINLATARGIGRAKEVGVRKTLGSNKRQLVIQFMLEALILNGLAMLLAVVLISICLPVFGSLSGHVLSFTLLASAQFWLVIISVFIGGSFFSGFYPAIVLSNFKPVEVMKGKLSASPKGIMLRKGMVIFQFAASIFLLIGSVTVYKQIGYMQQQKLGVNIDQTLVIKPVLGKVDSFSRSIMAFKQQSIANANVKSVTVSTSIPGEPVPWNAGGIKIHGTEDAQGKQYRIIAGDFDFLKAYGIKLIAGRTFSSAYINDPNTLVFNRSAIKQLGFEKPEQALNKQIDFWGKVYTIVGVVDDYHQQSLRDAYDALIFKCDPQVSGYVSVKIKTAGVAQTISALKENWRTYFPGEDFDYFFLDNHFNEQYQADQRFGQVFGVFTAIAILVACLGLFGLVSFTIVQRTKEIGIRKVLGASVSAILELLYKDFAVLIVIAFAVSAPLAWYAIHQWLQGYAFRISISWLLFLFPFITVLTIALATVSLLSVKAALMNPVKSLKVE